MTTITTTRRSTRKTRKADPKFVWQEGDATMTDLPTPNRQGHPKGTVDDPHNPTVEAPEKEPSEAKATAVAEPTQEAVPAQEKSPKAAGPYSREVLFSEAKVSKQYFNAFGRDGGTAIVKAASPGVEVTASTKAESLTLAGSKRNVDRAAKKLVATWVEGFAEFRIWRRTDEAYLALAHTGKEATVRYHQEQDHLREWAIAQAAATPQQAES